MAPLRWFPARPSFQLNQRSSSHFFFRRWNQMRRAVCRRQPEKNDFLFHSFIDRGVWLSCMLLLPSGEKMTLLETRLSQTERRIEREMTHVHGKLDDFFRGISSANNVPDKSWVFHFSSFLAVLFLFSDVFIEPEVGKPNQEPGGWPSVSSEIAA